MANQPMISWHTTCTSHYSEWGS